MPECRLCKTIFPIWMEIDGKKRNLGKRKYCIKCSPYKKRNTKQLEVSIKEKLSGIKFCRKCETEKSVDDFYNEKDWKQSHCKRCHQDYVKKRILNNKIRAVEYKGGKCLECGEKRIPCLHFHHTDSSEKEMDWNEMRKCSWKNIRTELDKCVLLCANCHLVEHSKQHL